MNAQRVFFALGLIVAAFTGVMIFARRSGARPEPLPFVNQAPTDTILYVAIPDHAKLADELGASPAWKRLGIDLVERYRGAQPMLVKATGPSAAFFGRRGGGWAAFFRLLGDPGATSGEAGGLHWVAKGNLLSVSDSAASARSALEGPRALLGELTIDRDLVCGATRAPFAWLDLRGFVLRGPLEDIGGLAFSATFGGTIEVKAIGNYYTGARRKVYGEYVNRPRVAPAPPTGAVAWAQGMQSAKAIWDRVTATLSEADRQLVRRELDVLETEFCRGKFEPEVVARLGPEWGVAFFDGSTAFGWARVPADREPVLRRALADLAKVRRDRGLAPFVEIDGDRAKASGVEGWFALKGRTLFVATKKELLDDAACRAFAEPGDGEWHGGFGWRSEELHAAMAEIDAKHGWKIPALPSWISGLDARVRYSQAGLSATATIR